MRLGLAFLGYALLGPMLFLTSTHMSAADVDERLSAASTAYEVMNFERILDQIGSIGIFGPGQDYDKEKAAVIFRRKMIESLAETYTVRELILMHEYYGSELGQSIQSKDQAFGDRLSAVVREVTNELFDQSTSPKLFIDKPGA